MPYVTSIERLAKAEGRAEGGVGVLLKVLVGVGLCGALLVRTAIAGGDHRCCGLPISYHVSVIVEMCVSVMEGPPIGEAVVAVNIPEVSQRGFFAGQVASSALRWTKAQTRFRCLDGKMKQTVEPCSGPSDSIQMRPPCTSTIRLARDSPTPVPPDCPSILSNSLKALST